MELQLGFVFGERECRIGDVEVEREVVWFCSVRGRRSVSCGQLRAVGEAKRFE